MISFTGSRETGILVTKAGADNLKHVHLELGGKNAIIVMDDADVDLAVDGIVWSAFGTAGQRCTAASRVIVQRGVYERAAAQAGQARRGDAHRAAVGGRHRHRPGDQRGGRREDPLVHRDRAGRGCEAAHRRRAGRRPGLLLPPDRVRRRRSADADRAGGDLRPDHRAAARWRRSRRRWRRRTASGTGSRRRSSRAT